jgi:uncharacterized membrane protein (UPF0182 family)
MPDVNYRRNSVKAVVDAYSGEVYLFGFGDDPLRDAWAQIYRNTIIFKDADSSRAGYARADDAGLDLLKKVEASFKYPSSLFAQQAKVYSSFHTDNPDAFYSKEDLWGQFANADGSGNLAPSYHLLTLPDKAEPSYALVLPFSVPGKEHMTSVLAASGDPKDYGKITALLLPKERVTLGPAQVLARIQQDPTISPQIALWNQNGNTVIYGDMLILPIEGSFAYVQPIFLQAQKAAITELVGVVISNGESVHMGKTLAEALEKSFPLPAVDPRMDPEIQAR